MTIQLLSLSLVVDICTMCMNSSGVWKNWHHNEEAKMEAHVRSSQHKEILSSEVLRYCHHIATLTNSSRMFWRDCCRLFWHFSEPTIDIRGKVPRNWSEWVIMELMKFQKEAWLWDSGLHIWPEQNGCQFVNISFLLSWMKITVFWFKYH